MKIEIKNDYINLDGVIVKKDYLKSNFAKHTISVEKLDGYNWHLLTKNFKSYLLP